MKTMPGLLLLVGCIAGPACSSMAYTTDVASLVLSISNRAAQLYLSPSQVAATFTVTASNSDSDWQFDLTATDGTNAYTFYYGTPGSNAVLGSASCIDPNQSGFRLTYRDNGGVSSYADELSNMTHGVEMIFHNDGLPKSLSHYVTNAVVGEEIYWNADGSLADDFIRTNPVPFQSLFKIGPP